MKSALAFFCILVAGALAAAPGKTAPVADGFPVWQGVTEKNHVYGREITPSDLRHKVAVVVDFECNKKLVDTLMLANGFVQLTGLVNSHRDWETTPALPRDVIVVLSHRGDNRKILEELEEAMAYKGDDTKTAQAMREFRSGAVISVYHDVTFEGAPSSEGKLPYFYVMGAEGTTPLAHGALDAKNVADAKKAIAKEKKRMQSADAKWIPFFGTVHEPKFYPQLAKTLEKGKPLKPVETTLQRDVTAKNEEKAKEAQILFDALQQTRGDLFLKIKMEIGQSPHRAYADIRQLLKYWPSMRREAAPLEAKLKAIPAMSKLGPIFCKLMVWSDPEFRCKNASEAKKIVQDLKKMKKDVDKFKETENIQVQNASLLMDSQIDTLIELVPSLVPVK